MTEAGRAAVERFRESVRELSAPGAEHVFADELPGYRAAHPSRVDVRDTMIAPTVPARLFLPPDSPLAVLVWIHGGGFVGGHLGMPEAWFPALGLAERGIAVIAADYRKALRGIRFPAPSDDVLAAWRWAVAAPERVGADRSTPISLGGASAGGGLVAGAAARLLESADELPRSLILVYPTLHAGAAPASAELERATAALPPDQRFLPELIAEMGRNLVGEGPAPRFAFPGDDDVDPRMPPTLIIDSDADDLRASGEAYARALHAAGVWTVVVTEPGTAHGHLNRPDEPGALRTVDRMAEWLLDLPA